MSVASLSTFTTHSDRLSVRCCGHYGHCPDECRNRVYYTRYSGEYYTGHSREHYTEHSREHYTGHKLKPLVIYRA